jgi:DNA-binding response OmpR family regulator
LFNILIIAEQSEQIRELSLALMQRGFSCSVAPSPSEAIEQVSKQAPNLLLMSAKGLSNEPGIWHLARQVKHETGLPLVVLVPRHELDTLDYGLDIDDFVIEPCDVTEVVARAKRVLMRKNINVDSEEPIRCGDLAIDPGKCEVSLSGRPVALTFKEYELLRFLACNKGRVFTRETLLDKVWGYDYYGGDRTVDVHIRRLRSKIEDMDCSFIETVRNIGYKFKEIA